MSSSIVTPSATGSGAFYLDDVRKFISANNVANRATQSFSYNFLFDFLDTVNVSDSATATASGSGSIPTQSDTVNVSDAVTNTTANTGTWQIPFDAANSTGVTNPIMAVGEFDVGF